MFGRFDSFECLGWCITAVSCGFLVLRVCGLSAASGFGCFLRCWWVDSAVMVVWFVHFVLCWFRFVFGFVCGVGCYVYACVACLCCHYYACCFLCWASFVVWVCVVGWCVVGSAGSLL